ncbi:hypothetical protein [Kitasatospora purpeofusca]|uniref:hypothetical protein n=1 Tax=Kitasatospora purpeofusca TaxID=67352 RepID=UPI00365FE9DC
MDAAVLAAWVASVIGGIATGAGTGLGTATAERIGRAARERLAADEESRRVLERFDGDPAAPGARADLQARLLAVIEQDAEFASRLRAAAGVPPGPPGSVSQYVHVGRDVKNGVIAIGPVSIRRKPGTIAVLITVVVIVLALAVKGVAGLGDSDNSPAGSTPTGAVPAPASGAGGRGADPTAGGDRDKAAVVRDDALVKAIAPDLRSMPGGWVMKAGPDLVPCPSDCNGRLQIGMVTFEGLAASDSSNDRVTFAYGCYDSVENAAAAYQHNTARGPATADNPSHEISVPKVGDSSKAESFHDSTGINPGYDGLVNFRVGTITATVQYASLNQINTRQLTLLARLLADRAQQAQNGRTPSAQAAA